MDQILADLSASISELKKNPAALLSQADGAPVAILSNNKPAAYLVPASTWEDMMNLVEDMELLKLVAGRRKRAERAVPVALADL